MREKYESLGLADLKAIAKARGLKGTSTMKKADLVELMLAEDHKEADAIAAHLIELNEERKDITARATEQAVKQIEEEGYLDQNVLVVFVEECPESVAGIVAGN